MKSLVISKKWIILISAIGLFLFALSVYRKDLAVVVMRIISMILMIVPLLAHMISEVKE